MANKKFSLDAPWFRYSTVLVSLYVTIFYFKLYYSEIIQLPYISALNLNQIYPVFISEDDIVLNRSFIDWAGVLYGFSVPLVLLKTLERFESLEKYFDRETVSLKIFIDGVMLLPNKYKTHKKKIMHIAIEYTRYVQEMYISEAQTANNYKKKGNNLLDKLRDELSFFFTNSKAAKSTSAITPQLLNQLSTIIDTRENRIYYSKQILSPELRTIIVLSAYMWLIPIYFLDNASGLYGDALVFVITLITIFILHTIEDLDEPFLKKWRLDVNQWRDLEDEFQSHLKRLM